LKGAATLVFNTGQNFYPGAQTSGRADGLEGGRDTGFGITKKKIKRLTAAEDEEKRHRSHSP